MLDSIVTIIHQQNQGYHFSYVDGVSLKEVLYSWGRLTSHHFQTVRPSWMEQAKENWRQIDTPVLPYGLGRSYGDSCLLDNGTLLRTDGLDHFISFNPKKGILTCEAGVSLADILRLIIPHGWFLPVTPGTKYVTAGGAVANDVHGKNHHQAGTFGCHVEKIGLIRRDQLGYVECSAHQYRELYEATIGGLGLTGLILWITLKLKKGAPCFDVETIKFFSLDEFYELNHESDQKYEYTVSWVDSCAKGRSLGRGILMRGNHAKDQNHQNNYSGPIKSKWTLIQPFPHWILNRTTIRLFNECYFAKHQNRQLRKNQPFEPFFYPLDSIAHWNLIYGRRGFYQYQFVIPMDRKHALKKILTLISQAQLASFLAVLKVFGTVKSPGMLSFPMPGVTLALDFPNLGQQTLKLFSMLDDIVLANNGRIYPAKDARMSREAFQLSFPQHHEFSQYMDHNTLSNFWQRVK